MRSLAWFVAAAAFGTALAAAPLAAADVMDPSIGRLVARNADGSVIDSCRTMIEPNTGYYNPASGFTRCRTDDLSFARLINEYGAAIAPTAMHSARTTGYGGLEVAVEAAFTKINNDRSYWRYGSTGGFDESTGNISSVNVSPDEMLQTYLLKLRKGFPFGLELTGNVGVLNRTNIILGGSDVRLSLLEGFRSGFMAIVPELAAGGGVRTITGTSDFQLTVASFDAQASKPLPIGASVVVTPYVGYQVMWIWGDSGLIDLTPNTDAVNYCNYRGPNSPVTPDPDKATPAGAKPVFDGQPFCDGGSGADFNNTVVFDQVRLRRHRIQIGLQLRFAMLRLGLQFMTDAMTPEEANPAEADDTKLRRPDYQADPTGSTSVHVLDGIPSQWTFALDLGAIY